MRKAREPRWWGLFFELYYPKVYLGILDKLAEEKQWFQNFLKKLPNKCPFERQYWIGNVLVYYVPALCKFNPLFSQLMELKVKVNSFEKFNKEVDKKFFEGLT